VALKVLPAELVADEERRQRFLREARTAAAVNHPNIAHVYEIGEADGVVFITMELVEGTTLRVQMGGRALPVEDTLRFATEMAEALARAHRAHVIHRDLKPDNVMIGTDGHVKILDFGLAKLHEGHGEAGLSDLSSADTATGEVTREGKILGTPAYMSPEQARGQRVDARSDIFAFGTTLYEMATGVGPFRGKTTTDTLSSVLRDEPGPASGINPGVPTEMDRIIGRCLQKEPEARYQQADDLVADLRKLQQGAETPGPHTLHRWVLPLAVVLAVVIAVVAYIQFRPTPGPGGADAARPRIVVLPFENLGPPEDEYFADGITEEITRRLAMVNGLGVISRKSAVHYAGTDKTIPQIGDELGVGYVLEGTIQWARRADGPSRVRITPQLIRVADDTHIWADAYDEVIDDIFAMQSEIAVKVIAQLGVTLLGSERRAIDARPTDNLAAYEAFLRGRAYAFDPDFTEESYRLGVQMFERAVELSSDFTLAWAELSQAHAGMYHYGYDRTPERQQMSKAALDRAAALDPDEPQVHQARGWYHYWCFRDYEPALAEFLLAVKGLPNDSVLQMGFAAVYRRRGRWEESLHHFKEAYRMDPRESLRTTDIAQTYRTMRRFEEAMSWLDRSIALAPDQVEAYDERAWVFRTWKGSLPDARAALEAMPETDEAGYGISWFWQEYFEGNHQEALARLEALPGSGITGNIERPLMSAYVHLDMGDEGRGHDLFDSARALYEEELRKRPDDYRVHSCLGIAFAGLGRAEDAIHHGKRGQELYPVSLDMYAGSLQNHRLAKIYMLAGKEELALDQIEYLQTIPSDYTMKSYRLEPIWRPLWDHPRFIELEREHEVPVVF
jgi:serine/threonine-protein kinase